MKKYALIIIIIILTIPQKIHGIDNTETVITDHIVEATLDRSGNMKIKEIIKVEGNYDNYTKQIKYKDISLPKFTGKEEDYEKSDIYNVTNLTIYKIGTLQYEGELNFDAFEKDIDISEECIGTTNCYKKTNTIEGTNIKINNKTQEGTTYIYIEYLLGNAVVMHEDIAEVYYNFINEKEENKNYKLRIILPSETQEKVKIWVHGNINKEVSLIKDENNNTIGSYIEAKNIKENTIISMRLIFPTDLIDKEHYFLKRSREYALNKILIIENKPKETPKEKTKKLTKEKFITNITSIIYVTITTIIITYIYIKHDKERKINSKKTYDEEELKQYNVAHIEYIYKKKITQNTFIASILNMINKNNITYRKLETGDYELTLKNEKEINENEKEIISTIFESAKKDTKTSKIIIEQTQNNKKAKKEFITKYNLWKKQIKEECEKNKYYEENSNIKLIFSLYSIIGLMVILIYISIKEFNILTLIVFILTIAYITFIQTLKKRTKKSTRIYNNLKKYKIFIKQIYKNKTLLTVEEYKKHIIYANIYGLTKELTKQIKNIENTKNTLKDKQQINYIKDWIKISEKMNDIIKRC